MSMYDYLIVGAGMTGATAAHLLWRAGKSVMVVDRRAHIAGNCYDEMVDGIRVPMYGGHIFHTNDERIWRFVNLFANFRNYEHRVKVYHLKRFYSFPPNQMTRQQLGVEDGIFPYICQKLFYEPFTEKAWGRAWEEIPEAIRKRVPIRDNWDDRYFTDRFQGLPEDGYTRMVGNMLKNIPEELEVDYCQDQEYWRKQAERVIYTGALDELMGYQYGKLEYRSLKFETQRIEAADYQGCPTVNYPERNTAHTVINEWQHYGWQGDRGKRTIITVQTPAADGDPYYPFIDEENRGRHAKYMAELEPGIIPAGRLGKFQYLNMDQAIGAAMVLVEKEIKNFTAESAESAEREKYTEKEKSMEIN